MSVNSEVFASDLDRLNSLIENCGPEFRALYEIARQLLIISMTLDSIDDRLHNLIIAGRSG